MAIPSSSALAALLLVVSVDAPGTHASGAVARPVVDDADVRAVPGGPDTEPVITVLDASRTEREHVETTVDRFRDAGLALPDLEVAFGDAADCHGHHGTFDVHRNPWRVNICADLPFVVPHELGHAWVEAHVDAADRAAYLDARRLDVWDDRSVPWNERGTEDAAFVIQQVVTIEPVNPDAPHWVERFAAYELLTGTTPSNA